MHVMVALRLVPDTAEEFELAADNKDIDREWIGFKLNEFDDHALEEAVLLKERHGARVTAVALEGEGIDRLLQTALARGADDVAKIAHDVSPPVPAPAAARIFAAAAESFGCDLILTGVQTGEDLFGQLAPSLGAVLDWPQVSAVSSVKVDDGAAIVQQEYSGGLTATHSVRMPAVFGIQTASAPPRYVSGSKLREVMSTKVQSLELDVQLPPIVSEIVAVGFPESAGRAEMVEGDADFVADRLAAFLRERGFVNG
jgi:electron transfer flavoprotein beta subunit